MWTDEFECILRRYLTMSTERLLRPDSVLVDLGLDSMGTVSLLVELEETFRVTFPDELLTSETFGTPLALWEALSGLPVAAG
jgi:acyl carrier protein